MAGDDELEKIDGTLFVGLVHRAGLKLECTGVVAVRVSGEYDTYVIPNLTPYVGFLQIVPSG
jgi:hypothetical protein